jgi:O-antigen/teichoic acid export membrane protein
MTAAASDTRPMTGDAVWNFGALAATAAAGAAVTFLIAAEMGAAALGVFAQVYAAHVIGAQIAVFGVHDSTQKHVAERHGAGADDGIVIAALAVVLVTATGLAVLVALAAGPAGAFAGSDDVARGLALVAPGIVAFAINKVLFAALNGRGRLRRYAGMQMVRALLVLAAGLAVTLGGAPAFAVGGIFAAAELLLLPAMLAAVRPRWSAGRRLDAGEAGWWRRHLGFGGRGLINGILLETHLRVDVVTLSYFVSDRAVGVYAFASLFAEALYQVPVVIRTVAYPTIVRLAFREERDRLAQVARRLALASGAASGAAALAILAVYPWLAARFDPAYVAAGLPVLQALLAGMTVYAFFVPVDQLLLQSGQPGRQSALMAIYVAANVVLNLVLIPPLGLVGAAVATAIALAAAGLLLLAASWAWLGYRGGVFLHRAPAA